MRTEAQLKQLAEARKHIIHKPLSEETKKKTHENPELLEAEK